MPGLRTQTNWTTRSGKRRHIRLYRAWCNMKQRTRGHIKAGNGAPAWQGIPILFESWQHFRAWSLAHGYSKTLCSLDRINPDGPYGPNNCRWVTVSANTRWENAVRYGWTTEELANYADVPF